VIPWIILKPLARPGLATEEDYPKEKEKLLQKFSFGKIFLWKGRFFSRLPFQRPVKGVLEVC
jgi:hypothetical protein